MTDTSSLVHIIAKTRPDAAEACRGGHVRVNGRPAKPATMVSAGDEVRARVGQITRVVEVVRVIQKRVGAPDAATCFREMYEAFIGGRMGPLGPPIERVRGTTSIADVLF